MRRRVVDLLVANVLLAACLLLTGCGGSGESNPKAPDNAPKLEPKTPSGGGKSAPKGKSD